MSAKNVFVFGLGYSAGFFARALAAKGVQVTGTVRTAEKAAATEQAGIRALVFDGKEPGKGVGEALRAATHLVVSIAPGRADPVLAHHRGDILAAPDLHWIGYLSTVGVYGDHGGAWVDEDTPPNPRRGRSFERLEAESAWVETAKAAGVPLALMRIAGIYGPGRNPLVKVAEGTAKRIVKPGQVFNRIHVADISAALEAAMEKQAGGAFNLADDEPAPPQDVVTYAAELMGVAPPPEVLFEEAEMSPMARSFYSDNKRVRNSRLKRELGLDLLFPDYRQGLDGMWREGTWRGG